MSEYQEKHSVSKLIGSPPGYVGFEENAGLLITKLQEHPNCVLLLDEIEKSHPDVSSLLLQIMDNGFVTGSNGKTADCRNIVLILTTNLGSQEAETNAIGFGDMEKEYEDKELKKFFAPEFRNRLDAIIIFKKLDTKVIENIAGKLLTELQHQINVVQGVGFSWSESAVDVLVKQGFSETMGARPMKRVINEQVKRPLARKVLFNKGSIMKQVNLVTVENKLELEFE